MLQVAIFREYVRQPFQLVIGQIEFSQVLQLSDVLSSSSRGRERCKLDQDRFDRKRDLISIDGKQKWKISLDTVKRSMLFPDKERTANRGILDRFGICSISLE